MISSGNMSRIFIILNILLTLINTGIAQEPRPASGILDEAGLFSDPGKAELAEILRRGLEDHALELYVATYRLVKGETIAERATGLRNAWAQSPFAVVLVYDESVDQISLVGTRDLVDFVSATQLGAVFQRAAAVANRHLAEEKAAGQRRDPAAMITRTVAALLSDHVLTERMSLPEPLRFSRPMVALLAAFILLASAAASLAWWFESRLHQNRRSQTRCSYFPTTQMPLRLGAPYSGGKGATIGE